MAYIRIKKASLVAKDTSSTEELVVPPMLSGYFSHIPDMISNSTHASVPRFDPAAPAETPLWTAPLASVKQIGKWVAVANIQRPVDKAVEMSLEDEVRCCFDKLKGNLS